MPMIGPFFYIDNNFIANKIPASQGELRSDKLDNPCSHEKLYDEHFTTGDYIDFPRGRVVWDIKRNRAIVYLDACIEQADVAIEKIAEIFDLAEYSIRPDEHYVCPKCMSDIWK